MSEALHSESGYLRANDGIRGDANQAIRVSGSQSGIRGDTDQAIRLSSSESFRRIYTESEALLAETGEQKSYRCLVHLVSYLPLNAADFCRRKDNGVFTMAYIENSNFYKQ